MTLPAKNSPCPCESGKKYKRCCQPRHQEMHRNDEKRARGIGEILTWLLEVRGPECLAVIDRGFFGVIVEADRPLLYQMPEHFRNVLMNNAYEWLLLEAEIFNHGKLEPVRDVVLGPGGPPFIGELERGWFQRAAGVPLAAYEIVEVHPGLGASAQSIGDREATAVRIIEPFSWGNFRVGDNLGLRLIRDGDIWVRSTASYGFDPRSIPDIEDIIHRARAEGGEPAEQARAIGNEVRELWTELAFYSFRDASEEPKAN